MTRRLIWTALSALLLCSALLPTAARAQDDGEEAPKEVPPLRQFEITRATSEIRVDGVLDEQAWADALVVDLPYEWSPSDNGTPPVETLSYVTYDNKNFYVAFKALDPDPSQIRAQLNDRDAIRTFVQDDYVGFSVSPFNDERRAFQFRLNPVGVQVDATFNELNQLEDFSWDIIWDSAARITADGYTVEIAIPLKQIRFPRGEQVQTWGFEAFRNYPRNYRHRISSRFTDRNKDCTLCQENKITGIQGIEPGLNLEFVPTLTGLRNDNLDRFPDGRLVEGDEDGEFGLTARWGVTPNFSLNAAINPDFSQVEADTAQLNVNNRFALFFPETRPFFLEGADFFETPLQAVFTRTIVDPNYGLKLTGKEGRNAIGVIFAEDDITNLTLPANQGSRFASIDDESRDSIFRYRRDIGARSTLGVLYAGRDAGDYENQLYGVDGFFRLTTSDRIRVQYLRSSTEYPTALASNFRQPLGSFDDDAFFVGYDHLSRNWTGRVAYTDLGEDFRADSGFIPRVDVRTAEAELARRFWGDRDDWYTFLGLGARGLRSEDQDGQLTDEEIEVLFAFAGARQSAAEVRVSTNREFFAGEVFDIDKVELNFQIQPSGRARFLLFSRVGDAVDLANGQVADEVFISPSLDLKLGRHVTARIDHALQTLDVPGGELFEANLSQLRLVYQFNVRTFIRAIFQYQDLVQNADLYPFPVNDSQEQLFSQLLFSYKLNPQTVFFAGYTETRVGINDISLTQTDRTLFVKVGYALLF